MPRRLTRVALSLPLAGALAVAAAGGAAPAGASAAHVGAGASSTHVASPHVDRRSVAPLSKGYIEITEPDGTLVYEQGTVGPINNAEGDFGGVDLGLTTPQGSFSVFAQGGGSSGPQPGNVYTSDASGPDQGFVQVQSPGMTCASGGPSGFELDQLGWQNPPGQEMPSPAAYQFYCQVPADAPGGDAGDTFAGALAYNIVPTTPGEGYYEYESDGLLTGFGNDNYLIYLGDLGAFSLNLPIVGMATTPDDAGYWMVASDGGIFAYGDASFYGSMGGKPLNEPIVGIASTPDGHGYWEVASDGGIFSFGDAKFYGSMGGKPLNKPIVGIAGAPGGGYWEVASDGGVFAFGHAPFFGSTGNIRLNKPVVAMVPTADGQGYWFVASDGGIFNYGDAHFHGSTGSLTLDEPIVGMAATPSGGGYWLAAADGGIFSFNATFYGSLGGLGLNDVVGIVK